MSALTTMEAVTRSALTHQEVSYVCVTKATISHMMRELVKVFISFVLCSSWTDLFLLHMLGINSSKCCIFTLNKVFVVCSLVGRVAVATVGACM